MTEKVICTKHKSCKEKASCGCAKPHAPDSECGKCPVHDDAECMPYVPVRNQILNICQQIVERDGKRISRVAPRRRWRTRY